jgi:hypothetical protein
MKNLTKKVIKFFKRESELELCMEVTDGDRGIEKRDLLGWGH